MFAKACEGYSKLAEIRNLIISWPFTTAADYKVVTWPRKKARLDQKKTHVTFFEDSACTWKVLHSILICCNRPSVGQGRVAPFFFRTKNDRHYVGHQMEMTSRDRDYSDVDLHGTAVLLFFFKYVLQGYRKTEIWEDNKRMQMNFTFRTGNMVGLYSKLRLRSMSRI